MTCIPEPATRSPITAGTCGRVASNRTADAADPARIHRISIADRRLKSLRSVRREAVEQPVAARGLEGVLAAAAARLVRGVPGMGRGRVVEARAVAVAHHRRA